MARTTQLVPLLAAAIAVSFLSAAAASNTTTTSHPGHLQFQSRLVQASRWRERDLPWRWGGGAAHGVRRNTVIAWVLSFLAASVSSAGGLGGGSLFVPILNLVAGLSLKRATAYSTFLITGGAASNVLFNLACTGGGGRLVDYDIALLFQPCLLLGVSIGVVCNVMFPEWLIALLFSLFLVFCTAKTYRAGVKVWRSESSAGGAHHSSKEPLLPTDAQDGSGNGAGVPWPDVALLVMIWLCFFALHVLIGDEDGKGGIMIKPCGVAYWLVTSFQLPAAVAFTCYILYAKRKKQAVQSQEDGTADLVETRMETLSSLIFPLAAFVTGILSGLFGIGGGLLLNPVLLQMGIQPETAAGTSSFMVLFCASMSMAQFILLGMEGVGEASIYAGICFVASAVGVFVIKRAIRKSGRVSLIVFVVTAIMALSTVIVAYFGAQDAWMQYISGAYMGFKPTALVLLLVAAIAASLLSAAAASNTTTSSHPGRLQVLLVQVSRWRERHLADPSSSPSGGDTAHGVRPNTVAAWVLSFLAASVSSAGGVGGGSLFLPILNLVAGLSLKRATAYSSFMVTGGAASNVLYNLLTCTCGGGGGGQLINYDIALLFQPCLLLGVSIGVVCNVMFPEWLITVLFSSFLVFCTAKTYRAGLKIWRSESRHSSKEPLLQHTAGSDAAQDGRGNGAGFPWPDVALLVIIWICFFALHVVIGDKDGKGVIRIKPCSVAYWLVTLFQLPAAVSFTCYILYAKKKKQVVHNQEDGKSDLVEIRMDTLPSLTFPLVAFVTGALGSLFGIGGGLLLNPVLLQIGIPPQTAAATSSFMVLFCASMSMAQYILLGMEGIGQASIYAGICFVASVIGVVVIERAVRKSGRVSLIVFLVMAIMALSTVIVTGFGAQDVWMQYISGAYMGFNFTLIGFVQTEKFSKVGTKSGLCSRTQPSSYSLCPGKVVVCALEKCLRKQVVCALSPTIRPSLLNGARHHSGLRQLVTHSPTPTLSSPLFLPRPSARQWPLACGRRLPRAPARPRRALRRRLPRPRRRRVPAAWVPAGGRRGRRQGTTGAGGTSFSVGGGRGGCLRGVDTGCGGSFRGVGGDDTFDGGGGGGGSSSFAAHPASSSGGTSPRSRLLPRRRRARPSARWRVQHSYEDVQVRPGSPAWRRGSALGRSGGGAASHARVLAARLLPEHCVPAARLRPGKHDRAGGRAATVGAGAAGAVAVGAQGPARQPQAQGRGRRA
ncbi:hypothetical protein U9M48_017483 [Paspalum notatum var. saurae]|uniref:Sulfite exporter TauE/SafE family protein n=1 Tax=Paspalum notatum var. saurae TaxID=547442 RepID=A0AAQ3T9J4_PASNO